MARAGTRSRSYEAWRRSPPGGNHERRILHLARGQYGRGCAPASGACHLFKRQGKPVSRTRMHLPGLRHQARL